MFTYRLVNYGRMIADNVRMAAFTQALRRVVTPDTVVVDIGTGTGIFALLACQYGARQVYAIEPNDVIDVARRLAAANGFADRIVFYQALSTQVTLPERADVIISDLRGVLPWFEQHIPTIVDARQRFLVPGGVLIPQRDTMWAAVVEAPELYRPFIHGWDDNPYGLDMTLARQMGTNAWSSGRVTPAQLLVEPRAWATLDYPTVEDPQVRATLTWSVTRASTAHGVSVWFERTVAEGIRLSHAPDAPPDRLPPYIHGNAFFPWSTPVDLAVGDTVSCTLRGVLDGNYVWSWKTRVLARGEPPQVKAAFTQSTFLGQPLSPARVWKQAADYVPRLNEEGQVLQYILARIDGDTPLETLARQVVERFPDRFATWREALKRVGSVSDLYSQ